MKNCLTILTCLFFSFDLSFSIIDKSPDVKTETRKTSIHKYALTTTTTTDKSTATTTTAAISTTHSNAPTEPLLMADFRQGLQQLVPVKSLF